MVTSPLLLSTEATVSSLDVQTTLTAGVVVPSVYLGVAVNCAVDPLGKDLVAVVVTSIDPNTAGATVNVILPTIAPEVAVMLTDPVAATAFAIPMSGSGIEATLSSLEAHLTESVMSCVDPSVYIPVALNSAIEPLGKGSDVLVDKSIDANIAGVTVNVAIPCIPLEVAVIVALPTFTPVATPLLLSIEAMPVSPEDQTKTRFGMVLPAASVPTAVNVVLLPLAILDLSGLTVIVCKAPGVTSSIAVPFTSPEAAVIAALPTFAPVATPLLLSIEAIPLSPEDHTKFRFDIVFPAASVPIAVNVVLLPLATLGVLVLTVIVCNAPGVTSSIAVPFTSPEVAVMVAFPTFTPVATPLLLSIEAIPLSPEDHAKTRFDIVFPAASVPTATNLVLLPLATLDLSGLTVIVCDAPGVTSSIAVPFTSPEVAVIVVLPTFAPVATPLLLSIEAIPLSPEDHAKFRFGISLPAASVPTAVNLVLLPLAMLDVFGLTVIACKAPRVTSSIAVPFTSPEAAVIVALPTFAPVATPLLLSIEAIPVSPEDHVKAIFGIVLPAASVPTAVNLVLLPLAMLDVFGLTVIACKAPRVTSSIAVLFTSPEAAVIVALPTFAPVATPLLLSIEATPVSPEDHVKARFGIVLPAASVPTAVNVV